MCVTARSLSNYQVEISAGRHRLISDEPPTQGDDAGPDPFDLLLGALGSCVVITLQMYARRKQWPLTGVQIELENNTLPAEECPGCMSEPGKQVTVIEKRLTFQGDLSPEQVQRLTEIADKCPVHKALSGEIQIRTSLAVPRPC
jgi:putative redox protein